MTERQQALARAKKSQRSVDYISQDAILYLATPNGSVRRVADCPVDNEVSIRRAEITLTNGVYQELELRRRSGFYGNTIDEVAERLICAAIRAKL